MNGLPKVWDGRGDGSSKSKASKTTQHDILFFSVYIYISPTPIFRRVIR